MSFFLLIYTTRKRYAIATLLHYGWQVESVAQKHMLPDSPDQVLTVDDTDNVRCESVNPDLIRPNDGQDNLKRVTTAEEMEASVATYTARPISSVTSDDDDNDDNGDMDVDDGDNAAPDSYALWDEPGELAMYGTGEDAFGMYLPG